MESAYCSIHSQFFCQRKFFFELDYSSAATKSLPNIPSAVGQRLAKDGSLCKRKSPPPNLAQVGAFLHTPRRFLRRHTKFLWNRTGAQQGGSGGCA